MVNLRVNNAGNKNAACMMGRRRHLGFCVVVKIRSRRLDMRRLPEKRAAISAGLIQ